MCASNNGNTCAETGPGKSVNNATTPKMSRATNDRVRAPASPAQSWSGGRQGGARRQPRDDRRKGGKAPLRGSRLTNLAPAIADARGVGDGGEDHATVLADALLMGAAA